MKVKKGDQVKILTGKDRGRTGKVISALPKEGKVIVEEINLAKKHRKPRKSNESGQIVEVPKPIDVSNVRKLQGDKSSAKKS